MKFLTLSVVFISVSLAMSASARSSYGSNPGAFRLDVSQGNVDSSMISALWQNPAGFTRNTDGKISGGFFTAGSSLSPFNYGLGYFTGNGSVGGALSIGGRTGDSSTVNNIRLGLAAEFPSAKFSLGFTGTYLLESKTTDGNVGLIFNPAGELRVGVVAYGVSGSPDTYGAGIAYDASSSATIAVDAGADSRMRALALKPALAIRTGDLHLTAGYGFTLDDAAAGAISEGFCAGFGYALDQKLFFAATLRQAYHYRFELTLRL